MLCIIAAKEVNAQPTQLWTARYNGSADSIDVAKDITIDNAGNVYVTGYSFVLLNLLTDIVTIKYSPAGVELWRTQHQALLYDEGSAITLDNTGQYVYITGFINGVLNQTADYVIIKYDAASGTEVWIRSYSNGLLSDNRATAIAMDSQNNPIITGFSSGQLLLSTHDFLTIKYNSAGVQLWANRLNGSGRNEDRAYAIVVDNLDNVFVTGSSNNGAIIGSHDDYLTAKYTPSGTQQWTAVYNGTGNNQDRAYAIIVDSANNTFVTGESVGSGGSGYDYATVKYSPTGSQQWVSRYNGTGNGTDRAYAIIVDNSGNVIVTGESAGSGSSSDYETVKYTNSGTQVWERRYNGSGNGEDRAYAIIVDSGDNVFVTGSSASSNGSGDYATLKYSPSGVQQWTATYNGTGNNEDRAYAIIVDSTGENIYVTGSSRNGSLLGSEDYLTIRYHDSNSITPVPGEIPVSFNISQNFPNPFNPKTSLLLDIPAQVRATIEIYDVLGVRQEVLLNSSLNPGTYRIEWNAEKFSSGIYFYKIRVEDASKHVIYSQTRKMILLK